MHRLALLALVAACSAPARAPVTNTTPSTRYTLQPIKLFGPEGRHSASHTTTLARGSFELRGTQATLSLAVQTDVTYVHCPPEMRSGRVHTMQQCADDSQQGSTTQTRITLTGDARWESGRLVTTVRDGERRIALSCDESYFGLTCAKTAADNVFGLGDRMVFATAATKHFELEPRALPAGALTGSLAVQDGAATVSLAIAGKPSVAVPGSVFWSPAGLIIDAKTSPTRTVMLSCKDEDRRLACEITADRSVLGEADHLYGPVVFVAKSSSAIHL